jgi:hypothetical protein
MNMLRLRNGATNIFKYSRLPIQLISLLPAPPVQSFPIFIIYAKRPTPRRSKMSLPRHLMTERNPVFEFPSPLSQPAG